MGAHPVEDVDTRLGAVMAMWRDDGGRITESRRAIVRALLTATEHVTAEDLAATVQAEHPDVHLSTVYRTLDALEQLGVAVHVHLGHGRAVYHRSGADHLHLVCEACEAVIEAPMDLIADVARTAFDTHGFVLRGQHFALPGLCSSCAAAPGAGSY